MSDIVPVTVPDLVAAAKQRLASQARLTAVLRGVSAEVTGTMSPEPPKKDA